RSTSPTSGRWPWSPASTASSPTAPTGSSAGCRGAGSDGSRPRSCPRAGQHLVQAELVPLGVGHDDEAGAHGRLGLVAAQPGGAECDQPLALGLQGRHPLVALETGCGPNVEVHAVLRDLVLRDLLEEDPGPDALGILERGRGVALLLGQAGALEELVHRRLADDPGLELDARRRRVQVAEHLLPERGEAARVVGVEGDLDGPAHADAPVVAWVCW